MRIHYASNSVPCHKLRIEDGLFIATRQAKPEHLLKKPLAWSYNVEIIEALKEADVDIMEVVYEDKVFSCPLSRFLQYARKMNRGYGEQLYLCLYLWDTKRFNELPKGGGKKQLVQPSLFSQNKNYS